MQIYDEIRNFFLVFQDVHVMIFINTREQDPTLSFVHKWSQKFLGNLSILSRDDTVKFIRPPFLKCPSEGRIDHERISDDDEWSLGGL